ncbi:MAG: serine/threonine-protein phosphatase [Anaerolineales bacterium]|nr:serine/threonine-protein phosphatase [Anaerolineales bacterium]
MEPITRITQVKVGHGTHAGMTGKHNEDSYGFFAWRDEQGRELYLGVVADGIGGQTAGELASSVAVEAVRDYFSRQHSVDNMARHLERAIMTANIAVHRRSQENPEYAGMGTTMVLAAFVENRLYTAYVGDSRIYLLRDGKLQQLSVDHTWAQEAIEAGLLTREQAKTHPNRNVIKRYLGGSDSVEVDHRLVLDPAQAANAARNQGTALQPGDQVLLCSDGLTDMITDAAVFASLTSHEKLQPAVDELIQKANEAGGKDNITVVTMQVPGGTPYVGRPEPDGAVGSGRGLRLGIPLVLGALALFLLLGVVGVGAYVFFNRTGAADVEGEATASIPPAATAGEVMVEPDVNPATAAVLLTLVGGSDNPEALPEELQSTPGLIPTLRALQSATPTRLPSITPRPTSTPRPPTATSSSSGGPLPTSTNTPRPTNTPTAGTTPTASNTPVTPTATNTPVTPTATNTPVTPTATATPNPSGDSSAMPGTGTPAGLTLFGLLTMALAAGSVLFRADAVTRQD